MQNAWGQYIEEDTGVVWQNTISPQKRTRMIDFGEGRDYLGNVYQGFTSAVGNVMGYYDSLTTDNQVKVLQAFNTYMFQGVGGQGGLTQEQISNIHEIYKIAKTEYDAQLQAHGKAEERLVDPNVGVSTLLEGLSYYLGQAQPNQMPPEQQGSSSVDDDYRRRRL